MSPVLGVTCYHLVWYKLCRSGEEDPIGHLDYSYVAVAVRYYIGDEWIRTMDKYCRLEEFDHELDNWDSYKD